MSAPVILDLAAIENLRSLNPGDQDEFLREIIGIFLEDTPQRLAELDESLAAGDAARFSRAAHSIKGSSANLGAAALKEVAGKLEHKSQKEGLGSVGPLVASVKVEFDRVRIELTKLLPA